MDIHKLATFIKKIAKINTAIGILLSILASAIINTIIPGTTLLEVILSVLVTFLITYLSYRKTEDRGLVANLYEGIPV